LLKYSVKTDYHVSEVVSSRQLWCNSRKLSCWRRSWVRRHGVNGVHWSAVVVQIRESSVI